PRVADHFSEPNNQRRTCGVADLFSRGCRSRRFSVRAAAGQVPIPPSHLFRGWPSPIIGHIEVCYDLLAGHLPLELGRCGQAKNMTEPVDRRQLVADVQLGPAKYPLNPGNDLRTELLLALVRPFEQPPAALRNVVFGHPPTALELTNQPYDDLAEWPVF